MTTSMVPVIRVVPNGMASATQLSVTLLVTPSPLPNEPGAERLDLEHWPSKIAEWFAGQGHSLDLYLQPIKGDPMKRPDCAHQGILVQAKLQSLSRARPPGAPSRSWQSLDAKWQALFRCAQAKCIEGANADGLWETLSASLDHATNNRSFDIALEGKVPDPDPAIVKGNLNDDGSLRSGKSGQGEKETVAGVLPVGHADFAEHLQLERGKRASAVISGAARPPRDDLGNSVHQARLHDLKRARNVHASQGKESLLPVQVKRLGEAYKGTAPARDEIKQRYDAIIKNAKSTTCITPPTKAHAPQGDRKAPSADQVAIAQYGNWPERSAQADAEPTLNDAVAQAFFSLQSSPALARVFGLAFDAVIEIRDILPIMQLGTKVDGKYLYGFLGVDSNLCQQTRAATAVRLEIGATNGVRGFLPATRAELNLAVNCEGPARQAWLDSCDHHSGLVPLSGCLLAKQCGLAGQRFVLTTLDVRRAIDQTLLADSDNVGSAMKDSGARYTTAGISLNDRRRSTSVLEDLASMGRAQDDAASDKLTTLYAEDLVVGHVVDVQALPDNRKKPSPWRSLMERHVFFDGLEELGDILGPLIDKPYSTRRMDLERARISPCVRVLSQPMDTNKKDLIVEEALMVWDGSPMGVDTSPDDNPLQQNDLAPSGDQGASSPLPFQRQLDLPGQYEEGKDRRPPPLRFGMKYRFAIRCVYAGGGGLTLGQATQEYERPGNCFALPKLGSEGQAFLRNESILSPDVLMLARDAQRELGVMGFESSLEIVLRTSNGTLSGPRSVLSSGANAQGYVDLGQRATPQRATRIIMPPAVGMEDAARHGMFDGRPDYWQKGAMPLMEYREGYPKCCDRHERGWNDESVTISRDAPTFATGQGVAVLSLKRTLAPLTPEERYYPDPAAHYLVIGLYRNGMKEYVTLENKKRLILIPFYENAPGYSGFRPVQLRFAARSDIASSHLHVRDDKSVYAGAMSLMVRDIKIELAPHDEVDVHLWCIPDLNTLAAQFALPQYMEGDHSTRASELWDYISEVGPVEALSAVQVIKAVHALNRPTTRPQLVFAESADQVQNEENEAIASLMLNGMLHLPVASADSYELYLRCASPHSASFDDETRARALGKRRAGLWPKVLGRKTEPPCESSEWMAAKDIFGFEVSSSGQVSLPTSSVLLVRADNVPAPRVWGAQTQALNVARILREAARKPDDVPDDIDLTVGKVALGHQFADRKARHLYVSAVAIGRHAPLFATRSTFSDQGAPRRVHRRVNPLNAADQSQMSDEQEVWLNALMQPLPPQLLACEPSFTFLEERSPGEGKVDMTRFADVRIRIKRPWFSSGEGEKLAIVLAREGDEKRWQGNDQMMVQAPFTRWGADPIWVGTQGETELAGLMQFDLDRCRHVREGFKYDLPVPSSECTPSCASSTPVLLLAFEPHFDVDREEWFVDVPLRRRNSADPFVRFVLVRYQPHTTQGIEKVSTPVEAWAKLLPERKVELTCSYRDACQANCEFSGLNCVPSQTDRDWCVTVLVKGLFHGGPSMAPGLADNHQSLPRIRLQLYHEHADPALGTVRRRPVFLADDPEDARLEDGVPWQVTADGIQQCKVVVMISAQRRAQLGSGQFVVYVSEFERFMPATYTDEFAEPVTWSDIKSKETLVETGARFSARIEVPTPT